MSGFFRCLMQHSAFLGAALQLCRGTVYIPRCGNTMDSLMGRYCGVDSSLRYVALWIPIDEAAQSILRRGGTVLNVTHPSPNKQPIDESILNIRIDLVVLY